MSTSPEDLYDLVHRIILLVADIFEVSASQLFLSEPCFGTLVFRISPNLPLSGLQVFLSSDTQNSFIDLELLYSRPQKREMRKVVIPRTNPDLSDLKKPLIELHALLESDLMM